MWITSNKHLLFFWRGRSLVSLRFWQASVIPNELRALKHLGIRCFKTYRCPTLTPPWINWIGMSRGWNSDFLKASQVIQVCGQRVETCENSAAPVVRLLAGAWSIPNSGGECDHNPSFHLSGSSYWSSPTTFSATESHLASGETARRDQWIPPFLSFLTSPNCIEDAASHVSFKKQ